MTVLTCQLCDEPFDNPLEASLPLNDGEFFAHQACLLRSVAGGVNHQRGTCFCSGGSEPPDPPSLTRREAAQVAFKYYRLHLPAKEELGS